jgi:hypothetical protein
LQEKRGMFIYIGLFLSSGTVKKGRREREEKRRVL